MISLSPSPGPPFGSELIYSIGRSGLRDFLSRIALFEVLLGVMLIVWRRRQQGWRPVVWCGVVFLRATRLYWKCGVGLAGNVAVSSPLLAVGGVCLPVCFWLGFWLPKEGGLFGVCVRMLAINDSFLARFRRNLMPEYELNQAIIIRCLTPLYKTSRLTKTHHTVYTTTTNQALDRSTQTENTVSPPPSTLL